MADMLLGTCAMIWIGNGDAISQEAHQSVEGCIRQGGRVAVSAFSAWELGVLVSRSRIKLPMPPETWFAQFCERGGIEILPANPEVLVSSSFLPDTPPKDPADRIIIASARTFGLQIVTRDRLILQYAEDGNVQAIAC